MYKRQVPFSFDTISGLTDDTDVVLNTAALAIARAIFPTAALAPLLGTGMPAAATYTLAGGNDGAFPSSGNYTGAATFADYLNNPVDLAKNGLLAFEAVEDISIVAAPGTDPTVRTVTLGTKMPNVLFAQNGTCLLYTSRCV